MLATPLCRCICGSSGRSSSDPFDASKALGEDSRTEFEDTPSKSPKTHHRGVLSYEATANQPLRGVPIREEPLWLLSSDEEVCSVNVSLYVNGISFKHNEQELSFSFSPFVLVRNCKFQATTRDGIDLSTFKCFKVSMFTQGACFYFGVREKSDPEGAKEAEEERSRWVLDIARAVRLVTQSLFPTFDISCDSIAEVPQTHTRLMAGYLAHHDDAECTSVLYCELHPQCEDKGRLIVYENESCEECLREIMITERSTCCEKVGISCSCFTVEEHLFSARSLAERKLWLRAISNIKVKVQNRAPNPTVEETKQYRMAIDDHVQSSGCNEKQAVMDALLRRRQKKVDFPAMPFGYSEVGFIGFEPPPEAFDAIREATGELLRTGFPIDESLPPEPPDIGDPPAQLPPDPPDVGARGVMLPQKVQGAQAAKQLPEQLPACADPGRNAMSANPSGDQQDSASNESGKHGLIGI